MYIKMSFDIYSEVLVNKEKKNRKNKDGKKE
jgi:hypothetical protein